MNNNLKKILFIINPISGVESKQHIPRLAARHLDSERFHYEITYTQYRNHAFEIAQHAALHRGFDAVIAVGGDGSINEVGSALVGTGVALGIIALGSGNGLARKMGLYTTNIVEAMEVINKFHIDRIDVGKLNDKYFFSTAGVGVEADVVSDYAKVRQRGMKNYVRLSYDHAFRHKSQRYRITLDTGEIIEDTFFMLTVANSGQYGYGIGLTPDSQLDDGLLELTMVPDFKQRLKAAWLAAMVIAQKGNWSGMMTTRRISRCVIEAPYAVATQIDGDPTDPLQHLSFSVLPQALKIIVS